MQRMRGWPWAPDHLCHCGGGGGRQHEAGDEYHENTSCTAARQKTEVT